MKNSSDSVTDTVNYDASGAVTHSREQHTPFGFGGGLGYQFDHDCEWLFIVHNASVNIHNDTNIELWFYDRKTKNKQKIFEVSEVVDYCWHENN